VTRPPTSSPLPTVRFVPTASVRVTTVARVPQDLVVLLVRMLTAILIGAALARPVLTPTRRPVARVVMADVSRAVGAIAEVRDSARALLGPGDVLVVFDSAARVVPRGGADTLAHLARTARAGRVSSALIAALRAAATLRDRADSLELVLVSPLVASEVDGATGAIRALWPGRVRIMRIAAATDSAPRPGVVVHGGADDPVVVAAMAAHLVASDSAAAGVRVERGAASAADSAWVARGRRVLVRWPATDTPPGFVARAHVDTVGAVVAGEVAVVTPWARRWTLDARSRPRRVVARWVDGEPAVIERPAGAGCLREVAIAVPTVGDVVLRPAFGALVRALTAPCAAETVGPALADAPVQALIGSGGLVARAAIRPPDVVATPLVPWLLGVVIGLVLLELLVRRGARPPTTP